MAKRDGIQERKNADGTISFRAQVRMLGAPPLSKTFRRRTDAKRWIEDTKSAVRGGNAPSKEAQRTSLREALQRYLNEITPDEKGIATRPMKGWRRQADRVKAWMQNPLAFRFLSQLRGHDFSEHRDARRKQGRAENTIRIELALISSIYKTAASDWGMEGLRNPIKSMTMPGGSKERDRRLSADEEKKLLEQLRKTGAYMGPLAEFAIESAMRQSEMLSLTWADVDLQKQIGYLDDSKNSERRKVPLSIRAIEILRALPRPIDNASPLFPMTQDDVIRTFRQACSDAKIEDLKFHDLRHEATSRICDKLPMHEAMRVTGHKTPAMLMRYYHPKAEDLARKLA